MTASDRVSDTHGTFAPVPDWLMERFDVNPSSKLVYARLLRLAQIAGVGAAGFTDAVTAGEIGRSAGMSERTARACLLELVSLKLVDLDPAIGKGVARRYRVTRSGVSQPESQVLTPEEVAWVVLDTPEEVAGHPGNSCRGTPEEVAGLPYEISEERESAADVSAPTPPVVLTKPKNAAAAEQLRLVPDAPPSPRKPRAPSPTRDALLDSAWGIWRSLYARHKGRDYSAGGACGAAMKRLAELARENLVALGRAEGDALALLEHWFTRYLGDDGRVGFSFRERGHRLQFLPNEVPSYGVPWSAKVANRQPGPALSRREPPLSNALRLLARERAASAGGAA
jgi:hypothetical protein